MTESSNRPVWCIVVAGGGGSRFGEAKQYVEIAGRRAVDWSVGAAARLCDGVVAVLPAADVEAGVEVAGATRVVAGGASRSASVRCGLAAVPDDAVTILVHDAARPAASTTLFGRVIDAVSAGADGVVPGVPVTDSLRRRSGGAVDRDELVAVQTPQGFPAKTLRAAHASGREASDDATLVEALGGTIVVVDGETTNVKLTHPGDRAVLADSLSSISSISSSSRPSSSPEAQA